VVRMVGEPVDPAAGKLHRAVPVTIRPGARSSVLTERSLGCRV
jgi:hypothetical protein